MGVAYLHRTAKGGPGNGRIAALSIRAADFRELRICGKPNRPTGSGWD